VAQCPFCKRNAAVANGRCALCNNDISALQAARDLPAHLYNAGLDEARAGRTFAALLKVAAASELGTRSEPWVVLGKLFANDGAIDRARECFARAIDRGASNVPDLAPPDSPAPSPLAGARSGWMVLWRAAAATALVATGATAGWTARPWWRPEIVIHAIASPPRAAFKALPMAPDAAVVATPPAITSQYVVAPGDTLWRIARDRLGAGRLWTDVLDANRQRIADPNRLVVGMTLVLPGRSNEDRP
jgi:hypothetical protein